MHIVAAMNSRIATPFSSSGIRLQHVLGLAMILLASCSPGVSAVKNPSMPGINPSPPGVGMEDLTEGHDLYTARCGTCHNLPDPAAHSAEKWPHLVDWMKDRAHLDSTQASKVLGWILSERAKGN